MMYEGSMKDAWMMKDVWRMYEWCMNPVWTIYNIPHMNDEGKLKNVWRIIDQKSEQTYSTDISYHMLILSESVYHIFKKYLLVQWTIIYKNLYSVLICVQLANSSDELVLNHYTS